MDILKTQEHFFLAFGLKRVSKSFDRIAFEINDGYTIENIKKIYKIFIDIIPDNYFLDICYSRENYINYKEVWNKDKYIKNYLKKRFKINLKNQN